jgi:hypothetical protein
MSQYTPAEDQKKPDETQNDPRARGEPQTCPNEKSRPNPNLPDGASAIRH